MFLLMWILDFWVNLLVKVCILKFSKNNSGKQQRTVNLDTRNLYKIQRTFLCFAGSLSVGACGLMLRVWPLQDLRRLCLWISFLAARSRALTEMEVGIVPVSVVLRAWQPMRRPGGVGLAEEGLEETSSWTGGWAVAESWAAREHPSVSELK